MILNYTLAAKDPKQLFFEAQWSQNILGAGTMELERGPTGRGTGFGSGNAGTRTRANGGQRGPTSRGPDFGSGQPLTKF